MNNQETQDLIDTLSERIKELLKENKELLKENKELLRVINIIEDGGRYALLSVLDNSEG